MFFFVGALILYPCSGLLVFGGGQTYLHLVWQITLLLRIMRTKTVTELSPKLGPTIFLI